MFDVGIDADGVLYDFVGSFRHYVTSQGIRSEEQCTYVGGMDFFHQWFDADGMGISTEDFLEICHAGTDDGIIFYHGEPFNDARESLQRLRDEGHKIHIITDRFFGTDNYSHHLTERWLDDHKVPYDSLTFSSDKTIITTDIMIEDKIENYDQLEQDGCYSILLDRPWNQEDDDRRRVSTLFEFSELVSWLTFVESQKFDMY